MLSPLPEVIVFAPGMYRHLYERRHRIHPTADEAERRLFNALQRQKGYAVEIPVESYDEPFSEAQKALLSLRRQELVTQTAALTVRASGHLSTTLRLPMGLNLTLGAVRQLCNNVRSSGAQARRKLPRLFQEVQRELAEQVPTAILKRMDEAVFGIKLISDIPLEWLPVGDLPLCIKHEVSRIPATPGNLSIELLHYFQGIGLEPSAFREILYVDGAEQDDPIRLPMQIALETFEPRWRGKLQVKHERVTSVDQFVEAVNCFDGALLVFDGHGSHDSRLNVGKIHIGAEAVDVWQLKGRIRVPPIVVLSACDTHALDRSHATPANGFLFLGAQSVIAALLPIDATRAAVFAARFIYRLSDFLPAALRYYGRSLRWPEVVTGMMRMQLVTDIIRDSAGLGLVTEARAQELTLEIVQAINDQSRRLVWPTFARS